MEDLDGCSVRADAQQGCAVSVELRRASLSGLWNALQTNTLVYGEDSHVKLIEALSNLLDDSDDHVRTSAKRCHEWMTSHLQWVNAPLPAPSTPSTGQSSRFFTTTESEETSRTLSDQSNDWPITENAMTPTNPFNSPTEVVMSPTEAPMTPLAPTPPRNIPVARVRATGHGTGRSGGKRRRVNNTDIGLNNNTLRRLARRGGVKRVAEAVYKDANASLREFMTKVIHDAITYCVHAKRTTVTALDMQYALKRQGKTVYGL